MKKKKWNEKHRIKAKFFLLPMYKAWTDALGFSQQPYAHYLGLDSQG